MHHTCLKACTCTLASFTSCTVYSVQYPVPFYNFTFTFITPFIAYILHSFPICCPAPYSVISFACWHSCLSLLSCSSCANSAASAASIRKERNHRWLSGLHCAFHSRAACQLMKTPMSRPGGGCKATLVCTARTLGARATGAVCGRLSRDCFDEAWRHDEPPRSRCTPGSPGPTTASK